jgi:hypothetical protein
MTSFTGYNNVVIQFSIYFTLHGIAGHNIDVNPIDIVRLTSINLQKKILKNSVFKSTFIFLDVY